MIVLFCCTLQRFLHENGSVLLESNGIWEEAINISHSFQSLKRNTVQGPDFVMFPRTRNSIIDLELFMSQCLAK
jgi:hypothetical protein